MQRRGFSLPETLIIGAIAVLLAVVGTGLLSLERARLRDAKRITDITRFAGAFAVLYAQHGGYEQAAVGSRGRRGVRDIRSARSADFPIRDRNARKIL